MEADPYVSLSVYPDQKCAMWYCPKQTEEGSRYCHQDHENASIIESAYHRPACLCNVITHHEFIHSKLHHVFHYLTTHENGIAQTSTGIPDLHTNLQVVSIPPWQQPYLFNTHLNHREEFRTWIFLGPCAPHTRVWRRGVQPWTSGNMVRYIYRAVSLPLEMAARWILHGYMLPEDERVFYFMKFIAETREHPLVPPLNHQGQGQGPEPQGRGGGGFLGQGPEPQGRGRGGFGPEPQWRGRGRFGGQGPEPQGRGRGRFGGRGAYGFGFQGTSMFQCLQANDSTWLVTRSLLQRMLQKRLGAKGVQKRTKAGASLGGKSAEQVNNVWVFSFEDDMRGKFDNAMNPSVMPKKQWGRRNNADVCLMVQSREKDDADGIQREMNKSRTPSHTENTRTGKRSWLSDKMESSFELHQQSTAKKQKPYISTREKDFHPLPEDETAATPEMFHGLSKNGETEFQSQRFGYKAPFPSPYPLEASTETTICSSFSTKRTSRGTKGQASDTKKRLPILLEKKGNYSFGIDCSAEPNEDLFLSFDVKDSDGSTEDSPALGHYDSTVEREIEKSKPGSSSAKRNSHLKGNGGVVLSPTSSFSEGIHETDFFQRFSEMAEDEGLGRAVALFAVALQNLEKKLKSAAKKKSSEIIASVSEDIHLELENVKPHIITQVGMTINLAKTKRKHAETRLQEQQEKMRMILEKFKVDVGNQLEDFKSTIEGLEANHSELKRSIKKQRTSHQEFIAYFEGGIETILENATKRIDSVNESAKGKMLELKMIV